MKNVPGNNGRVGMLGISYPGFYAACGMIDSHPALKCVSPQAPVGDWFIGDDFHHNGALFLADAFGFLSSFEQKLDDPTHETAKPFDYKTPDGYEFYLGLGPLANADKKHFKGKIKFWNEIMAHPNYDEWWKARTVCPHLKKVRAAVMTVGGWYDAEDLYGTLKTYRETERLNPGMYNVLVMGPWSHGDVVASDGDRLGNVAVRRQDLVLLPRAFRAAVSEALSQRRDEKDEKTADGSKAQKFNFAEANVFETGTNQWRHFDAWPPKNVAEKSLYLARGRPALVRSADRRWQATRSTST